MSGLNAGGVGQTDTDAYDELWELTEVLYNIVCVNNIFLFLKIEQKMRSDCWCVNSEMNSVFITLYTFVFLQHQIS